jgi:arylsulfatase
MFGNRAIYHDGWVASARHSVPWVTNAALPALKDDIWELYNINEDFTQANDLSAKNPEKLKELKALFVTEAIKNRVFPIDDRRVERFNAAIAGRPDLIGDRTTLNLYEGMTGMMENTFINFKNRSYTVTAYVDLKKGNEEGVIISQAGRFGGWTLFMKGGKVFHEYNFFGLERTKIGSPKTVAAGIHKIKYEFIADTPNKPATGGKCYLYIDDQKVAEGLIPRTEPFAYSGDEGVDVGMDNETNVSNDYKEGDNKFTGKIEKITVDLMNK